MGPLLGGALLLGGLAVPGFSRPASPEPLPERRSDRPTDTVRSTLDGDPVRTAMDALLADLEALGLEIAALREELTGSSQDEELLQTLHHLAAREASLHDALARLGRWLETPIEGAALPASSPPLFVTDERTRR